MKKFFNERHEVILYAREVYVGSTDHLKNGDKAETKHRVETIGFYQPLLDQYGNQIGDRRVSITKDMIIDLYNQIQQIELETFMSEFDNLPF